MKICDIAGKTVKISPRSITVKSENGKTAGVVRDAYGWKSLPNRTTFEYFKKIKEVGIWGTDLLENLVYCDGEMYFLHDLGALERYEKYFGNNPEQWPNDTKRYNERKEIAEKASAFFTVIPCYIVK